MRKDYTILLSAIYPFLTLLWVCNNWTEMESYCRFKRFVCEFILKREPSIRYERSCDAGCKNGFCHITERSTAVKAEAWIGKFLGKLWKEMITKDGNILNVSVIGIEYRTAFNNRECVLDLIYYVWNIFKGHLFRKTSN